MKAFLILIGSIFFFLGVIGFIVPIFGNTTSILQAYNICNSVAGSIGQALSGDAKENCENVYSFLGPLFLVGFVGFILLIVGLVKK